MTPDFWPTIRFALTFFLADERGAELAEYMLILALVLVAAITAMGVLSANPQIVLFRANTVPGGP